MTQNDSYPIVIKEWKQKFLLGLVSIKYLVENRRPDLNNKYKHFLNVRVFWIRYNWTFVTVYPYPELPYTQNYITGRYSNQESKAKLVKDLR